MKQLLTFTTRAKFAVIVAVMVFSAIGLSAQQINMVMRGAPVKNALEYLQLNYGYSFSIKTDEIDVSRVISINARNASISEVVEQLFAGQDVRYTIDRNTIIVVSVPPADPKLQQRLLTGYVSDERGLPLVGATVIEKNVDNSGTSTGADGRFSLVLKGSGPVTVVAKYIGYGDVEESVAQGRKTINITMSSSVFALDEVVVVGYGTQRRASLTGAVATINFSESLESRPTMNASSSLAGLSAGLQVQQSSGQPGSDGASLRIRGNGTLNTNSPLVLVDGIEWSMDNINQNDIESITVLKDAASTAIYGSRAANGVILVTTKLGKGATRVTYSFGGIFQTPYNDLAWVSDYARHMELVNEACDNINQAHIFSNTSIDAWKNAQQNPHELNAFGVENRVAYPNTDWFGEIFGTGFSQEHNVAVEGSSNKVKYMLSLGYLDNNGVMTRFKEIDSSTSKINFRTNIEAQLNKWLKIGTRTFGMKQDYGLANVSNAFSYIYQTTPGVYPGAPDKWGRPANTAEESSNANNIFAQMAGPAGHNTVYRFNTTMFANMQLMKGLTVELTGNFAPDFTDRNTYSRKNGMWNYTSDTRYSESELSNATNGNSYSMHTRTNIEALLRYNNKIGNHEIGALAGYTSNYYGSRAFNVSKIEAPDWNIFEMSSYTNYQSSGSSTAEWSMMSYFGRINYAYRDRYLFEANIRFDGSSRFSPDSRWGKFPSFSAGWRIKEEDFLKDVDWLSNLKLRASWGVTGNNNSGNYAWQATYDSVSVVVDGKNSSGLLQTALGNSQLEWETTYTSNMGIDFGFMNQKLSGEIDFYIKNTKGILFRPSIYETMGNVTGAYANIAAVRNSGVELSLNYNDRFGSDFRFNVGLNVAYNVGYVTKYKGTLQKEWITTEDGKRKYVNNMADVAQSGFGGRILEGHLLGEHYIYNLYRGSGEGYNGKTLDLGAGPKDGMIRSESDMAWVKAMIAAGYSFRGVKHVSKDQLWYGDFVYADYNGDGNYGDTNDMDFNSHISTPKWNTGLNISMSWKNIDFYALLAGSFGFYLNWGTQYYNTTKVTNGHGISQRIADDHYFYDPDNLLDKRTNLKGTYPRMMLNDDQGNSITSDFREYKGDYVKLKNVQLGYTLPQIFTRKFSVNKLRVYASAENLFTITKYPGLDPEIGTSIGYPLMRSISLGAQVTF